MSTFVIGDVQGCYDELLQLLEVIKFHPTRDTLWFTGDLVNRGPKSLEVLRFIYSLPQVVTVLGNHDLCLLALAYTDLSLKRHNLQAVLEAADREVLLAWLRQQPLFYQEHNAILVHAGIPPQWTFTAAAGFAREVEECLQGERFQDLLRNLFGDQPCTWSPELTGWERYRFIINGLTRMRFCDQQGNLELTYKGTVQDAPSGLIPWFKLAADQRDHKKILFGHWSALNGEADAPYVEALDTGCFWGGTLTALRLEDNKRFTQPCNL